MKTQKNKLIVRIVADDSLMELLDSFVEMPKFFDRATDSFRSLESLKLAIEFIELLRDSVQSGLHALPVQRKSKLASSANEIKIAIGCDMPQRLRHMLTALWTDDLESLLQNEIQNEITKHKVTPVKVSP